MRVQWAVGDAFNFSELGPFFSSKEGGLAGQPILELLFAGPLSIAVWSLTPGREPCPERRSTCQFPPVVWFIPRSSPAGNFSPPFPMPTSLNSAFLRALRLALPLPSSRAESDGVKGSPRQRRNTRFGRLRRPLTGRAICKGTIYSPKKRENR